MKKSIIFCWIVLVACMMQAASTITITKQEQQQFLKEAEDWMDDMPDGLQDRLSDAINHSLHGFFSEIAYFRNIADTTGIGKYKVVVKNFSGGNNSNIPMRLYSSAKTQVGAPLLIYFHGGGWSVGNLNVSDKFCRALASKGKVKIISVAYPLAPENSYPVALNICKEAVNYIVANYKNYGCNPKDISLGGDGAGGNLALATCLGISKESKNSYIKSLVLFYPLLNVSQPLNPEVKRKYGRGYGLDSRVWEAFTQSYNASNNIFQEDYLANPSYANLSVLKSLPPVLIISAGRDIVLEESKDLKNKLSNVTYIQFDGAVHGFITDNHQVSAFKKAVAITNSFL